MTNCRPSAQRSPDGRSFFWMLKLVTAFVAPTVMSMSAYAQSDVETGRVQITFMKAAGEGNGNLFFDGQKYGLSINGIKIGGFRITRIDLVGTASKLRSASDIIGKFGNDFSPSRTLDVMAIDRAAATWGKPVFFGDHFVQRMPEWLGHPFASDSRNLSEYQL